MPELAYSDALIELREAYEGTPVPRDELDAGEGVLDDLERRGEVVAFDEGLAPIEAYRGCV
jgi:hypothetical protein